MKANEPTAYLVVDEIINGKRWIGKNLQLIRSFNNGKGSIDVFYRDQLLTTKDKSQFLYCEMILYPAKQKTILDKAKVLTEEEAKALLSPHKKEYIETFGEPELA